MKEQEETQKLVSVSPLPILARLDRLEHALQLLEERQSLSTELKEEHYFKTLSSALQEVELKGNIIERLRLLENRILELRMEMDAVHTSRSSTSCVMKSQECNDAETYINNPQGGQKFKKGVQQKMGRIVSNDKISKYVQLNHEVI